MFRKNFENLQRMKIVYLIFLVYFMRKKKNIRCITLINEKRK